MDTQRRHAQKRYDELHAQAGSLIESLQEELDQNSADVNADGGADWTDVNDIKEIVDGLRNIVRSVCGEE